MSHYAIEIIGNGKNKHYMIKQVFDTIAIHTDKKQYKTLENAKKAAMAQNIKIEKVGNCYQIL